MTSVVVIGGSAGAVDAVLAVMQGLPEGFAAPIVVVLHLMPGGVSLLPMLIARATRMTVREIYDKDELLRGTVHVAPPNYHALVERGGSLALSVDPPVNFSRPSIDVLFESAADALGARAVGVLLSGANEDGARGLARIRAAGGEVIIQDPGSTPYPAMPAAALRLVPDARVMKLEDIAGELAKVAT
jgi:two-component system chemotaxis response regulator CheB